MRHQRQVAVDGLQQQEIRHLGHAARAGLAEPRTQRLGPLAQHAHQLAQHIGQRRHGGDAQGGRDVAVVDHHAAVGLHFDDAGQAQAGEAGAFLALQHVAQPGAAHRQLGRQGGVGMGVVGLEGAQGVARGGTLRAFGRGHFRAARLAHRQGQVDDLVARALDQVERPGLVGGAGDGEGRAVLEHAGDARQRELARAQQVAVKRQLGYAPGMRTQRRGAGLEQMLEVAILLLIVLGAEEHALLPHHLVVPGHAACVSLLGYAPVIKRRRATPPHTPGRKLCRRHCRNHPRTAGSPAGAASCRRPTAPSPARRA